jgi:hypothetical protein
VGFGILGAGVGCVVPTTISAAGRLGRAAGGTSTGGAVAAVVGTGYVGWLVGPPLVGGLAELVSLRVAMLVVAVLTALIAILAPALSR